VLKVKYVSLPNLIADAPVVKELLLHHCNAGNMVAELALLLDQEGEYYKKQQAGYGEIARRLTNAPSAETAACRLIDKLKKK
jgi:lipid-A-disaccharide synthase